MSVQTNVNSTPKKTLSLKACFVALSINSTIAVIILISLILMIQKTFDRYQRTQELADTCILLTNELKQSSNDLTNLCRMFVSTNGDTKYLDQYNLILDWRTGMIPRPQLSSTTLFVGETISLYDLLSYSGFTREELDLVNSALQMSDVLAQTEIQAINTIQNQEFVSGPKTMLEGETIQSFAARIVNDQEYNQQVKSILDAIDTVIGDVDYRLNQDSIQVENRMALLENILLFLSISLIAAVAGLIYFLTRFLLKPVLQTSSAFNRVSTGDLTTSLKVTSDNETGKMFESFNTTMEQLRRLVSVVQKSSEKLSIVGDNLSNNMEETSHVIAHMEKIILEVKKETQTQVDSVSETSSSIQQVIKSIQALNDSIYRQVASLTQSTAGIEEMVANVNNISKILEHNDQMIQKLAGATSNGKSTVAHATEVTKKISEASGGLMEASSIIQHIASQTNMLAMNAAIEAAHAGEAGQGFAVVADEIRKLAEESSLQGKSITSTLKSLSGEITSLSEATQTVEQNFNDIFDLSEKIHQTSAQINLSMQEQGTGSQEVLASIRDINAVTMEVQDSSKEMLQGSEVVVREITRLNNIASSISSNMNEMESSITQTNTAIENVQQLAVDNKVNIANISKELKVFTV